MYFEFFWLLFELIVKNLTYDNIYEDGCVWG